jgi:hypothetical protein
MSITLLAAAAVWFGLGVYALAHREDVRALFGLMAGALSLSAATEMRRATTPKS